MRALRCRVSERAEAGDREVAAGVKLACDDPLASIRRENAVDHIPRAGFAQAGL